MSEIFRCLNGIVCIANSYGRSQEWHDGRLKSDLQPLQDANLSLNTKTCEFAQSRVKVIGQVIYIAQE